MTSPMRLSARARAGRPARDSRGPVCPARGAPAEKRSTRAAAPSFGAMVQRSPVATSTKSKRALSGPASASLRADAAQIGHHRVIARQHQMVAVVDGLSQHRVEIGAAAPAGLRRAFEQHDARALLGQRHGGGEPGQPAADDIDRAHPNNPWRSTMPSSLGLLKETRRRGGAQPAASILAQDLGIDRAHQARRADAALGTLGHDRVGLRNGHARARDGAAGRVDARIGDDGVGVARGSMPASRSASRGR